MTRKSFYWLLGVVFEQFIGTFSAKILFDLGVFPMFKIRRLFIVFRCLSRETGIFTKLIGIVILLFVNAICSEVPEPDLSIITSCGELVNIWQVNHAQNNVADEPWCPFSDVLNVLFLFFVQSHRF